MKMMKRADFLKGLLALPLALKGVSLTAGTDADTDAGQTWAWEGWTTRSIGRAIEWHSGGLRIRKARLEILAQTGDAQKRLLTVRDHQGTVRTRTIMLSGAVLAVAGEASHRSELAYQLAKRTTEIARDMAYDEWGDEWCRRVHEYQVENGLYEIRRGVADELERSYSR